MNPIIKQELTKIKSRTSFYDDNTTKILIYSNHHKIDLKINGCYLIEVNDHILSGDQGDILTANWNRGIKLNSKYLKIQISNIMKDMIQFDATGYDYENKIDKNDTYLSFWLPNSAIFVLEDISNG